MEHELIWMYPRNDILLIIDEVQSGFGRTGNFWSIQESGVRPDILLTAKVLSYADVAPLF